MAAFCLVCKPSANRPSSYFAMYNTPAGIRILRGAERRLFVESLAMIVDNLSIGDVPFDAAVFDDLQRNQKIAVLHSVARALLCDEEPVPVLTASIEAAAAMVFRHAADMVAMELNEPDESAGLSWRELVLAACRDAGIEGLPDVLPVPDDNSDAWLLLMDCLEGRVLWDNDWEMDVCLDADPDIGRRMRRELGIDDDYFVAVPPDPTDAEVERLLGELCELTADAR